MEVQAGKEARPPRWTLEQLMELGSVPPSKGGQGGCHRKGGQGGKGGCHRKGGTACHGGKARQVGPGG